jgi:hypothetical protein
LRCAGQAATVAKQRYLEEESVRVAKHKSFMEAEKLTHRKREMEVRRRPGHG